MKELNLDEVKCIQLEILDEVAQFCEENNVKYSLSFGTLLGAVRHKGYIAWDDDIDIMMLREDYEFFIKNFTSKGKVCKLKSLINDKLYPLGFSKVEKIGTRMVEGEFSDIDYELGINIDIFPVDEIPTGIFNFLLYFLFVKSLHKVLFVKSVKIDFGNKSMVNNITLILLKLILIWLPYNTIPKLLNSFISNNYFKNSEKLMVSSFPSVKKSHVFPKEVFTEYIYMPFEGKNFKAVKEFDSYLSIQYGNYMKLPPVDQRVSHHKFKAYLLNL